jgi:AraC-like DNA-binding protein
MFEVRIKKWLTGFKKYLFTYEDGYFQLPCLSNSPDLMVEYLQLMPFTTHNLTEKVIYIRNVFADGAVYYRELEDGLWLTLTEIEYKRNVATRVLYDNGPCDYYFLSHFVYTSHIEGISTNNNAIPTVGWSLYKPGTEAEACFNKGDKGVFINFAFNRSWFARNIPFEDFAGEHVIKQFLISDVGCIKWGDVVPNSQILTKQILELMKYEKQRLFNNLSLKIHCSEIINRFFTNISAACSIKNNIDLHRADRQMLAKAEKILLDNLSTSFPGIEAIAIMLNISPTKLKMSFKTVYGTSLYQYYQQKQMELALEILKAEPTSIKDIALTFGYENPSKFSSAFKKYHNLLPSEV